jgi:tetratricopeptide (TPR) repeat protein
LGGLVGLEEHRVRHLTCLLAGQFDRIRCDVCGHDLGVRPTVLVRFSDPPEGLLVVGSLALTKREGLVKALVRQAQVEDPAMQIREVESFDGLRRSIASRLRARFDTMNLALEAIYRKQFEYIVEHWRELTAKVFAAYWLALVAPMPGVAIAGRLPATDIVDLLARIQAEVWFSLIHAWWEKRPRAPRLEDELRDFIHQEVILPSASEYLFELLKAIDSSPDRCQRYIAEAVRASVCAAQRIDNPKAAEWADLFFAFELDLRTAPPEVRAQMEELSISHERAAATVTFRNTWNTILPRLCDQTSEVPKLRTGQLLRDLEEVAAKAGHEGIVDDLVPQLASHILQWVRARTRNPDPLFIDVLVASARKMAADGEIWKFVVGLEAVARPLVAQGRFEDLERLADEILHLSDQNQKVRASVEIWLGSCLKKLRRPARFLERIGDSPRDWEAGLEVRAKADLWNERANALRLLGRQDEALEIALEVERLFAKSSDPAGVRKAGHNTAILLRETGAPDQALDKLVAVYNETLPEEDRLEVLDSLAVTLTHLGRFKEALDRYDEAIPLAVGPHASRAGHLRSSRAFLLASGGRYEEALTELRTPAFEHELDPLDLVARVWAWVTVIANVANVPDDERQKVENLLGRLPQLADKARQQGDIATELRLYRALAAIGEFTKPGQVRALWEASTAAAEMYGQPPDALELATLAWYAWTEGNREQARKFLCRIPASLTAEFGDVKSLESAVYGPMRLRPALDLLVSEIVFKGKPNWRDVRLAAELRRDVIGQARTNRRRIALEGTSSLVGGLSDDIVDVLAPDSGSVGILEWIDDSYNLGCFLTLIDHQGGVSGAWLVPPAIDLANLARRLPYRLSNWHRGRHGDPLDLPDWNATQQWLVEALAKYLDDGDRVVFFEHDDFAGLPWHVAAAPRWPASYAPGWSTLLRTRQDLVSQPKALGVVLVPRFRETEEVLVALSTSAERSQATARRLGLDLMIERNTSADYNSFQRIMQWADVAKVLTHGFVSSVDGEVALMLAHDQTLPLANLVAAGSEMGRRHRLSWRDCQRLQRTPNVVFSAACSTGMTYVRGLGERIGLFGALRSGGTRALIAPRWDIVANAVLPILDDALDRFLVTGRPLGLALHEACAASHLPRWLAYALALEGDWR